MRVHRSFSCVQLWQDPQRIGELVRGEHLAAARIEPILRRGHDEAVLDLTFCRDSELIIVPSIIIPTRMVAWREGDPLLWPAAVASTLDDATVDGVRDRLLPWIVDSVAGKSINGERFKVFAPAFEATWAEARRRCFLGAAPIAQAWAGLAPYVFAQRFVRNRTVVVAAESGARGHAVLARTARSVRLLDVAPDAAELSARWFGTQCEPTDDPAADVVISDDSDDGRFAAHRASVRIGLDRGSGERVVVGRMVPFDVAFAFSDARTVAERTIAVKANVVAPPPTVVSPKPRGGSAGRIVLILRPGGTRFPDSDTDEARALASLLQAEGFDVEIASSTAAIAGCDLVHVIGVHEPARALESLVAARRAGVPTVVTPQLRDFEREELPGFGSAGWGMEVALACFSLRPDDASVELLLDLVKARRLNSGRLAPTDLPTGQELDTIGDALALADAIVVSVPGEERLVRDRLAYAGVIETIAPFVPADAPASVRQLVGNEPFALIAAPLEPRSNALAALFAAEKRGIRLVVAGPVVDASYAALLHERAGDRSLIIENPSHPEVAGLLASARLYVDCSWAPRGSGRLVRSAAAGAVVLAPALGRGRELLGPTIEVLDPADVDSLGVALDKWLRQDPVANALQRRAEVLSDQRPARDRLLQAYARAAEAHSVR